MNNQIIYIVINGSLNMSPGKAIAQGVHAFANLSIESQQKFSSKQRRTVIVLEAEGSEQIRNLEEYLSNLDYDVDYYIDEGVNEIPPFTITALAVGPIDEQDLESIAIFNDFELYPVKRYKWWQLGI